MRTAVVPEFVLTVARRHVESLRPVEGFLWRLSEGRRVAAGWYFDYEAERLPSNPPGPGSGFGYAPGFILTEDGSIRVVGWQDLRKVHGRGGDNE
jgi:hypothetical protein